MRLLFNLRPPELVLDNARIFHREAARAIVVRDDEILLLYTKYYNDYSFPGGGVEEGEDLVRGLHRELAEETGAQDIQVIQEYGYIDEIRPHHKPEFDWVHMLSYFYVCQVGSKLGPQKLESYEINNGMEVRWINIHEAIAHNLKVTRAKEKSMGQSIVRETRALELVAKELSCF